MSKYPRFDRNKIRFQSVMDRKSKIEIRPTANEAYSYIEPLSNDMLIEIGDLAIEIDRARQAHKPVVLCMGAHPIKNGACLVLNELVNRGYITHIAANGACAIHDWEFARFGKSTECVRTYVAEGKFGIWRETGQVFGKTLEWADHDGLGWGETLGMFISKGWHGPYDAPEYSVMKNCYEKNVPFTIHPGIGQDIVYSHPSVVDLDATIIDFEIFVESIRGLQGGVFISVGSSVMSPMIFEKALSMARNVEIQSGRHINDFILAVNDLADSNWDWDNDGEPPMDNPAYYLRFMKSFNRMGGDLRYFGVHNVAFLRNLLSALA